MDKFYNTLQESLKVLDSISDAAISEDIEKIKTEYINLISLLNEIVQLQLKSGRKIDFTILNQMEILFAAMEKGDFIKIVDLTTYEMKPILYGLERIGEYRDK